MPSLSPAKTRPGADIPPWFSQRWPWSRSLRPLPCWTFRLPSPRAHQPSVKACSCQHLGEHRDLCVRVWVGRWHTEHWGCLLVTLGDPWVWHSQKLRVSFLMEPTASLVWSSSLISYTLRVLSAVLTGSICPLVTQLMSYYCGWGKREISLFGSAPHS